MISLDYQYGVSCFRRIRLWILRTVLGDLDLLAHNFEDRLPFLLTLSLSYYCTSYLHERLDMNQGNLGFA